MCLIFFAIDSSSELPFALLSNRDEFYARPTLDMHWWENEQILAGIDLEAGGTWLAIGKNGRIAALTNYRDLSHVNPAAPSRGKIPIEAVQSILSAEDCIDAYREEWSHCNGFNLILHDGKDTCWYSNVKDEIVHLEKGIYGVSNAFLDTPWPKLVDGKAAFTQWLEAKEIQPNGGFELMLDTKVYSDEQLPQTGVGLEMERILSARCIVSPIYGTRNTTWLQKFADGTVKVMEKNIQKGSSQQFEFGIGD